MTRNATASNLTVGQFARQDRQENQIVDSEYDLHGTQRDQSNQIAAPATVGRGSGSNQAEIGDVWKNR